MSQNSPKPLTQHEEANRDYWNEVTRPHMESDFYSVKEFLAGKTALYQWEIEDLGDVRGKSLLHLQCHFGLDTLSWAREGAIVTGVDIADVSVDTAREIAEKGGLKARFICSNILDLPGPLAGETFDIVYSSRGALCWIRDLDRWAKIVAELLNPGGFIYIHDTHPLFYLWQEEGPIPPFRVEGGYFHNDEPLKEEPSGHPDYAGGKYVPTRTTYEWRWTIADLLNALIKAGLVIDELREEDGLYFEAWDGMVKGEDGLWRFPGEDNRVPMAIVVRAHNP